MLRVYSIFLRLFVVRHITDFVHEIDHDVGLPQNVRRAYTDFTIDGENNYWTSGDPERSIFYRGGVLAWRLRLFRAIFAVSQVLNSGVDKQLADCLRHLPSVSMPENEHSSESARRTNRPAGHWVGYRTGKRGITPPVRLRSLAADCRAERFAFPSCDGRSLMT